MTVLFPDNAVPTDYARRPLGDLVVYWVLKEHPALADRNLTLEFGDDPSSRVPPWVRVSLVRYLEPSSPGEQTPIIALDVYDTDALAAGDTAQLIAAVWPYLKKVTVTNESAYISGAWVEVDPYRLAEPDEASTGDDVARYHLEVGIRLHPTP